MPFAVGQVQDAGLIFLSSMARFVVADGQSHDDHAATTMAAALWTLGLATALLGVMLIVIGRLRLASLAQYLPVPVVGGYLGIYRLLLRPGRFGHDEWCGSHFSPRLAEALSWERPGEDECRRRRGFCYCSDFINRRETKVVPRVQVADHASGFSCDLCRLLLPTLRGRLNTRRSAFCMDGSAPCPLKVRKEAHVDGETSHPKAVGPLRSYTTRMRS